MSRFVFSDLHSDLCLWNHIKDFIKPDDQLWFLGDAADRGPDGYEIIKEILAHPQITYLKGNHELILADAILEWCGDDSMRGSIQNLYENDGRETFESWIESGQNAALASTLRGLPTYVLLEGKDGRKIHLSHAGFSTNKPLPKSIDLLWDRKHINDDYEDDTCLVIHGHTPVQFLDPEGANDPAPIMYGNKIDIDLGTPASKRTCLLDIDELKTYIVDQGGIWW